MPNFKFITIFFLISVVIICSIVFLAEEGIIVSSRPDASNSIEELPVIRPDVEVVPGSVGRGEMIDMMNKGSMAHADSLGVKDMEQYNKLLYYTNNFFEFIANKDYNSAYGKLNPDFLKYKGIKDIDDFKKYIYESGFEEVTCNIISVRYIDGSMSKLECALIKKDEIKQEWSQAYVNSFLKERSRRIDNTLVIKHVGNGYAISLDGFISSKEYYQTKEADGLTISLYKVTFLTEKVILSVDIKNNSQFKINFGTKLSSIEVISSQGFKFLIDTTLENDILPMQSIKRDIPVKYIGDVPKTVLFHFKGANSVLFDIDK